MSEISLNIKNAVNANRNEIVSFVKEVVRTPSLANDEENVQNIIHDKLKKLNLDSNIVPVVFNELNDHPAFNDDGFSPDSRINVTAKWKGSGKSRSLILNGHVAVSYTHLTLPTKA